MREFDLVSVDWNSVRLMQAGQLKQETFYLEELARWTLQRGRFYGLLHLADDGVSRPSPEGYQTFSVSVHGCYAVGANGYLFEIPDDARLAVRGHIEARQNIVPLYIGVAKTERQPEPDLHPSVEMGLLQCGGRRRAFALGSDNADARYEWLQIAQFEKTPDGLAFDSNYVPECMFLSAHAAQWRGHKAIVERASQALDALQKHSTEAVGVWAAALALAGSLGPAAVSVDSRLHPHAYVERLAGVLTTQRTQLLALPDPNLSLYQQALDDLSDFTRYVASEWTMGQALQRALRCMELLLQLYPPLLQRLGAPGPEPERQVMEHDIAVPVPAVGKPAETRNGFWRR